MKFGPVAAGEAEGAILAHTVRHGGGTIRKGTVLSRKHIDELASAGIGEVVECHTGLELSRLNPVHGDWLITHFPV